MKPLNVKVFMALLLARLPRFERGTFRLGGGRSILLSYRRVSTASRVFQIHSDISQTRASHAWRWMLRSPCQYRSARGSLRWPGPFPLHRRTAVPLRPACGTPLHITFRQQSPRLLPVGGAPPAGGEEGIAERRTSCESSQPFGYSQSRPLGGDVAQRQRG